ncbi:MAG: hypothetical protein AAGJ83_01720, partial [Planctomycetota bacterium]
QLAEETDPEKREALKEKLVEVDPLSVEQVEQLEARTKEWIALNKSKDEKTRLEHQALVWNEWLVAGKPERAETFALRADESDTYGKQWRILSWYYRFGRFDEAEGAIERLISKVRQTKPKRDQVAGYIAIYQSHTWKEPELYREFIQGSIDLQLELAIARAASSAPSPRNCSLSQEGYFNKSIRNLQGASSSIRLRSPLLPCLLPDSLIYDFLYLCDRPSNLDYSRREEIDIPPALLVALAKSLKTYSEDDLTPPPDTDVYQVDNEIVRRHLEAKLTYTLAAFVDWWSKKPDLALAKIRKLHQRDSANIALTIELARLQAENGSPDDAIVTLDSFEVLNSDTLMRKELAVLNLASMAGDQQRASEAAERLFGMRMDRSMQMALATQLTQLGMSDKAGEILSRARRGRTATVSTLINMASSFAAADRRTEAAEVAFQALKRLSNRRTQESNQDYYRRRAVQILQSSERLEPIIAAAEQRLEASPKSNRLRAELSELYTAAGESEKLAKLLESVSSESVSNDPRLMLTQASALYKSRKYDDSAKLYAKSLVRDPSKANNEFYNFRNSFQQAKTKVKLEVLKELSAMDFSKIQEYRLNEFIELCSPNSYIGSQLSVVGAEGETVIAEYFESILFSLRDESALSQVLGSLPLNYLEKSERIKKRVYELLLRPSTFSPACQFASVRSYSSTGTANGAIASIVALMASEELRTDVRVVIADVLEKNPAPDSGYDPAHAAGLLFDLLVETGIEQQSDSSTDDGSQQKWLVKFETLVDSIPEASIGSVRSAPQTGTVQLSSELLWQAGQILEERGCFPEGERRDRCLERIYRFAYANSTRDQFQYSPGVRWLSFAKKSRPGAEVRRAVWNAIESTDYFGQDAYNPGYGDYRMIEGFRGFAESFQEIGFPIDGLTLMAEVLSDPRRFERAAQWGGRSDGGRETLLAQAAELAESITEEQATDYLRVLIDSSMESEEASGGAEETSSSKPSQASLEAILTAGSALDFALAIEVLSASEDNAVRENVASLLKREEANQSRTVKTLQLAWTLATESADVSETACQRYIEESNESLDNDTIATAAMLTRLAANRDETRGCGEKLLDYTIKLSGGSEDSVIRLKRLAESAKDRKQSLMAAIEALYESGEKARITSSMFAEGLALAERAAKEGSIAESVQLTELILRRGMPIQAMSQATGDAFAIRSRTSSNQPKRDPRYGEIDRVLEMVEVWGEALGTKEPITQWPPSLVQLQNTPSRGGGASLMSWLFGGAKKDDASERQGAFAKIHVAEEDRDVAEAIFRALQQIRRAAPVDLPSGFSGRVVIDRLEQRNSRYDALEVFRSLVKAEARLAIALGRTDELFTEEEKSSDAIRQLTEQIDVAHVIEDAALLERGIGRLKNRIDNSLPAADEVIVSQNVNSYSFEALAKAANTIAPLDAPLRVLLPVALNSRLPIESRRQAAELCKRISMQCNRQAIPTYFFEIPSRLVDQANDRMLKDSGGLSLENEVSQIMSRASEQASRYGGNGSYASQYFARELQTRMNAIVAGSAFSTEESLEGDLKQFKETKDVLLPLYQASMLNYEESGYTT